MRLFFIFLITFTIISSSSSAEEYINVPNPNITPGEVITTNKHLVCMKGFSKMIRRTTYEMKRKTYQAYEIRNTKANKIDHLVPLSLGGADSMKNIWPTDFNTKNYTADDKDRLELKIRKLVCSGKMSVQKGQKLFMRNWQKAYDKYCPTRSACPSYKEIMDKEKPYKHTYKKQNNKMKVTSNNIVLFDGLIIINFNKMIYLIKLFFKEIENSN